eukprot:2809283-Amphidinium_carterae.4
MTAEVSKCVHPLRRHMQCIESLARCAAGLGSRCTGKASFTFAVEANEMQSAMRGIGNFLKRSLEVETQPGDEVRVVGTEPVLGAWNPQFGQVCAAILDPKPTRLSDVGH